MRLYDANVSTGAYMMLRNRKSMYSNELEHYYSMSQHSVSSIAVSPYVTRVYVAAGCPPRPKSLLYNELRRFVPRNKKRGAALATPRKLTPLALPNQQLRI
jgi:hypothetical protein